MSKPKLEKVSTGVEVTGRDRSLANLRKGNSRKGIPNKNTADIKSMIHGALDKAGGEQYLLTQAHDNPVAFMGLIAKVLPKEINAEVKGSIELVLAERLKAARERLKS
jgi:hypothetical protein